jgi:nitric oxide reductase NorQ protein
LELSRDKKFYRVKASPVMVAKPTDSMLEGVAARNQDTTRRWLETIEQRKQEEVQHLAKNNKIPPIPSTLFIRQTTWNLMSISVNKGKYPLLLGPKGCGKTEAAESLALALGYDFRPFNLGAAFKPKQFFAGMLHANEKGTEFLYSDFLTAFQADKPTLIFLDEATRLPQAASNYLMSMLDRKQNYVYVEELGKRIYKSDQVHFIAAANVGMQYTDTRTIDGALWDRLIKLSIDYLKPEEEFKLIATKVPNVPHSSLERLIKWANICRQKEADGELTTGVSTRQVIDMADFLSAGMTLEEIYSEVFLYLFVNGQQDERANVKAYIAGSGL